MSENTTSPKSSNPTEVHPEAEAPSDDTAYANPLRPVLWLVLPFLITLLYGIFAPG